MRKDVTVAIPSIPVRSLMLTAAVGSVLQQQHPARAISIAIDSTHDGAWVTRQRALDAVQTEWVAFLDDDDQMYPQHLRRLLDVAEQSDADYVYSYWDLNRFYNVFATPAEPNGHFGRVFDPDNPNHTTMTIMVRTELAKSVGFTPPHPTDVASGEDWRFTLGCVAAGANIVHLPEQTWFWNAHHGNTSGQPHKW